MTSVIALPMDAKNIQASRSLTGWMRLSICCAMWWPWELMSTPARKQPTSMEICRASVACNCSGYNWVNSLAPGKFEWHFRYLIFQIISVIDGWGISCELALRWMSLDLTDDKPTLVQVMAWCRQATSHYPNQWWPRSLSPHGVTRPQWVKQTRASIEEANTPEA